MSVVKTIIMYLSFAGAPCENVTMTTSSGMITTEPTPTMPPITTEVLLPTSLIPSHYDVVLRPNLYEDRPEDFSLHGSMEVILYCNISTDKITVHIQNLNVTKDNIVVKHSSNNSQIKVHNCSIDESERHFLTIMLEQSLEKGSNYTVKMNFSGTLQNEDLSGLYYSTYTEDGEKRCLSQTLFCIFFNFLGLKFKSF